jgi:nitrate reductase delta subunit
VKYLTFCHYCWNIASTLDDIKSRAFLGDAKKIIKIIADNLDKAKSPYSKLIRIVEKHSCLTIAA